MVRIVTILVVIYLALIPIALQSWIPLELLLAGAFFLFSHRAERNA